MANNSYKNPSMKLPDTVTGSKSMGEYRTFQAKAKTKQGLYLWKTMERLDKTTRRQSRKRRTVYTRTRKSSSEKQPDPPNGQSRFRAIQKQPNPPRMYSS